MLNENENNDSKNFGPRLVILSAEMPLLSWLRLSLALMSLGFVLDRFGIFIRMKFFNAGIQWLPRSYTFWVGIGLVSIGALTSAASGIIYRLFRINYLKRGFSGPRGGIVFGILASILITLIGILTAIFLATISD